MTDPERDLITYRAPAAFLPEGWCSDVYITVDAWGTIRQIDENAPGDGASSVAVAELGGPVIPGMPNLHSHAFQRAMAGLAEVGAAGSEDSFWGWREVMYGFLDQLGPDDVQAVAAQLYVEMLEAGYTTVGEFHYLHHDPVGERYGDPAEMSLRILQAARATGIGLTLLPVLYMTSGFGSAPPEAAQRRFTLDPDEALDLYLRLCGECRARPRESVGLAFHSLRAVPPWAFPHILDAIGAEDTAPIHIHVAEQRREVEDCVAWSGARPVEWLLSHVGVDARWCLVHATHMARDEIDGLAASGAVAGLCPTTEANLGDGLFGLERFLKAGGTLGIGSDSHVSVSPVEELRWLEYGQRLHGGQRNVAGSVAGGSTGADLYRRAARGGAQALAQPIGALTPGARADMVVLDPSQSSLIARSGDYIMDSWIFSGNRPAVRDVMVGGEWLVRDGAHRDRERVAISYRETMRSLV